MGVLNILKTKIFTLNSKEEEFFKKELEDMSFEEIVQNTQVILQEISNSISDILKNINIKKFSGLYIGAKSLRSKTSKIRILSSVLKGLLNELINDKDLIDRIIFCTEKIDVYLSILINELKLKGKNDVDMNNVNISVELIQLRNIYIEIEEIQYEIESLIQYNIKNNEELKEENTKIFVVDIYSRRYSHDLEDFFFKIEDSKEIYNNCLKSNIKEYVKDDYLYTLIDGDTMYIDKIAEQAKFEIDINLGVIKVNDKLICFKFLESLKILDVGYHTEIVTISYEALQPVVSKFYIKKKDSLKFINAINKAKEAQIKDENISIYYKKYM